VAEDKILRCSECGTGFIWAVEEQAKQPHPSALCPMCLRLAAPPGQHRGIIKWFNRSKGYGFITGTDGTETFVHKNGFAEGQPLPRTGQLVQFALATGPRGAQAAGVRILETPQSEASDASN
jgi:cold shock CspA family protein